MIDTVCQLTILAKSVFERMCVANPRLRLRLRPCRWRLADSSPLMVRGELCMMVVFPGLQCDMTLVIANMGSEGLLGMEALQSCLPHQLDLRMVQLWAVGNPHCSCISNVRQSGRPHIPRVCWSYHWIVR